MRNTEMHISACIRTASSLLAILAVAPLSACAQSGAAEQMTPLLLAVHDAPVPFHGSDNRTHLVYELAMTNFSSGDISVQKVEVLGDGAVLQTLDGAALAARLQPAGVRDSVGTLPKSTHALLFLNVTLAPDAAVPRELSHRVAILANAAPPGHQNMNETGGTVSVDRQPVVQIGPPLRGAGYISADSCCDATRHTRAAMPIDGRVWIAQRFAVDWEQLNASGTIYSGPQQRLESYAIFGQPAIAVADAVVASVVDGQPEQTPGKYPTNIPLADADGNCVILDLRDDLGNHRYALYAHLQPGSVKVHRGEHVTLGQVLGLVGDSGNSVVPHLHFQVTAGPSSMASNGLPYEIRDFQITGKVPGATSLDKTAAFDKSETDGSQLPVTPITPPENVKSALPLDQYIIAFPSH
jgi:Peptidase family M23